MTPTVANLFRKMATARLAEIRAEAAELEQALAELDGPSPAWRAELRNLQDAADEQTTKPATPAPSPLAARLEELRDTHGPVFVLDTTVEYTPGQVVKWGKNQQSVEVLEATPETPPRWYARLLEV